VKITRHIVFACTALILSMTALAGVVDTNLPAISYVSFESPNIVSPDQPLTISGQLRIPVGQAQNAGADSNQDGIPAVVVLHGSAGLDSRGSFYIEALNDAGIATLEIDMWSARGLSNGGRPALPTLTVPDAFSALKYLAENPAIDKDRIGVLGFSWGGVVTMLAATNYYTSLYGEGHTFNAYVAHYPVCWAYSAGIPGIFFNDLTGGPVLIQIGDHDDYDDGPGPCEALAASFSNVAVHIYKNAYHAWDRLQPAITIMDPFAHQGVGGEVEIVPNPGKAFQSRSKVVQFFETKFGTEKFPHIKIH
jgi:dienelactone hydrolase